MLLFVCCSKCREVIEARDILDVCEYLAWKCPKCGEWNAPSGCDDSEEIIFDETAGEVLGGVVISTTNEEVEVTEAPIDPSDTTQNILEGIHYGD